MFGLVPFSRGNNELRKRDNFWDLDRFFDDFFNMPFFGRFDNAPLRADIRETENEWLIDAELPGMDKKDIQIDLNDGYLTISATHNNEINEEKENYIRRERICGSYKRSFFVDNVKEDQIKATYKDGILSLTLPKAEPDKKKKVNIEIQ